MRVIEFGELTKILPTVLSPVILISGVGLLILAMANRFTHVTSLARSLSEEFNQNKTNNCATNMSKVSYIVAIEGCNPAK